MKYFNGNLQKILDIHEADYTLRVKKMEQLLKREMIAVAFQIAWIIDIQNKKIPI